MASGREPPEGASINYWLSKAPEAKGQLEIKYAAGETIRTLEGGTDTGSNRVRRLRRWRSLCGRLGAGLGLGGSNRCRLQVRVQLRHRPLQLAAHQQRKCIEGRGSYGFLLGFVLQETRRILSLIINYL